MRMSSAPCGGAKPSTERRGYPSPLTSNAEPLGEARDEAPSRFGDADGLQPLPRYGIPTGRTIAWRMLTCGGSVALKSAAGASSSTSIMEVSARGQHGV